MWKYEWNPFSNLGDYPLKQKEEEDEEHEEEEEEEESTAVKYSGFSLLM